MSVSAMERVTRKMLLELLERQEYRCAMTGRELKPETASLDHKISVSTGGSNGIDNLWIVHEEVNRAKATTSVEAFVELCCEIAANREKILESIRT